MNKYIIVEQLALNQTIETMVKKLTRRIQLSPNYQDLCQDLYLDLLEKSDDMIVQLYERGELEKFVMKMIKNNIYSYSSRFYKEYRKFSLKTEDINDYIDMQRESEFRYE